MRKKENAERDKKPPKPKEDVKGDKKPSEVKGGPESENQSDNKPSEVKGGAESENQSDVNGSSSSTSKSVKDAGQKSTPSSEKQKPTAKDDDKEEV
jgi:hypothetical protein